MTKNIFEKEAPLQVWSSVGGIINQVIDNLSPKEIVEVVKYIDSTASDWGVTYEILKHFMSVYKEGATLEAYIRQEYEELFEEYKP